MKLLGLVSGGGIAETLREARIRLPEAVAKTDELIADLRAGMTSITHSGNKQSLHLARDLLAGKPPAEVFHSPHFYGSPEEAEAVSQLPLVQLAGTSVFSAADVLRLNTKLKTSTSPATVLNW